MINLLRKKVVYTFLCVCMGLFLISCNGNQLDVSSDCIYTAYPH